LSGTLRTAGVWAGRFASHAWPLAVVLGGWQLWISLRDVNPLVAPSPADVARDIGANPGVYANNAWHTLLYAALGLAIGTAFGTLLAVLSWLSALLAGMLAPLILVTQSVPFVAVVPIVAGVLGYSAKSVLVATALISLFPSYVYTRSGLRAVPPGTGDVFSALGASRRAVLFRLALPAAMPNWLIALRLNAALAIVAAIVGEYLMGQDGLGWMFTQAFGREDLPQAWGASLLIIVLSLLAYMGATKLVEVGRVRWSTD
jgi:NitT/TauT family transport system permease protein